MMHIRPSPRIVLAAVNLDSWSQWDMWIFLVNITLSASNSQHVVFSFALEIPLNSTPRECFTLLIEFIHHGLLLSAWLLPINLTTSLQWVQDNTGTGCAGRLPEGLDCSLYTPVRLYDLPSEGKEMFNQLVDLQAGHDEVLSILELEDESFELGVLTAYIPKLKNLLDTMFSKYSVDWEHRPFDPSMRAVESFCTAHPELSNNYTKARFRIVDIFLRRAEEMIEGGFSMQKSWYSYLLKLYLGGVAF